MAWDGFATNQCSTEIDKRPDKKLRQGFIGVLGGSDGKESICNAGDLGLVSGSGRSRGEANGNPLQYSCLGHSRDRGAWWDRATVNGVTKSQTRLSDWTTNSLWMVLEVYTWWIRIWGSGWIESKMKGGRKGKDDMIIRFVPGLVLV